MKILSVDDSNMIRKLIRGAVEVLGHEFLEARDGQEGLEMLQKHPDTALVLLDWNMPRLDGFSVLQKIKADPKLQHIPVTMVTTEVDRARVVQAIQAGAKNYVMKPFSPEDLATKILESLGQGI